jgi:hypothetical protein
MFACLIGFDSSVESCAHAGSSERQPQTCVSSCNSHRIALSQQLALLLPLSYVDDHVWAALNRSIWRIVGDDEAVAVKPDESMRQQHGASSSTSAISTSASAASSFHITAAQRIDSALAAIHSLRAGLDDVASPTIATLAPAQPSSLPDPPPTGPIKPPTRVAPLPPLPQIKTKDSATFVSSAMPRSATPAPLAGVSSHEQLPVLARSGSSIQFGGAMGSSLPPPPPPLASASLIGGLHSHAALPPLRSATLAPISHPLPQQQHQQHQQTLAISENTHQLGAAHRAPLPSVNAPLASSTSAAVSSALGNAASSSSSIHPTSSLSASSAASSTSKTVQMNISVAPRPLATTTRAPPNAATVNGWTVSVTGTPDTSAGAPVSASIHTVTHTPMGGDGDDSVVSSKDATSRFVSEDADSRLRPADALQQGGSAVAASKGSMDLVRLDIDAFTSVWRALGVSAAHLRRALDQVVALRSLETGDRQLNRHQTALGNRSETGGKSAAVGMTATFSAPSLGATLQSSAPVRDLTRSEFCAALRFVFAEWDAWQRADTRVELVDRRPRTACSLL